MMAIRKGSGNGFDRRAVIAGFGAFVAAPSAFAAQPVQGGGQAEWSQGYDSGSRVINVRSDAPILSPATVQATEAAIQQYQQIIAGGGFIPVRGERLRLGMRSDSVVPLRRRLIQSGDIDPSLGSSPVFDAYVEAGVKRFQGRHGLGQTGVVAQQTYAALNTSANTRLKQLEINLVRLRSLALGNLGNRYVTINIPAAYVETVENGVVATRHTAGVGKIDRQSPIMSAKITEVNFNPFWTVPASVIRKDLIPKMQADPSYLRDNKIRIFNGAGQELAPEQINWRSDEALKYRFRQDQGGEFNSLGFMRINVHSPHGVYMHDSPAKGIFGDDFRFVSSGCVRVQNVRAYAEWLLKETPGWDRDAIERAIASGQRVDAKFREALFTHWVYVTAWATPEGVVQFRDDIYNRDGFGPGEVTRAIQNKQEEELE